MVSTKSVLEANDSREDLVVSCSKLGKVFRSEGLRHTPVQQRLNHLGLQHSGFQAKRGGLPIIQPRAKPFESCSHQTDPSVDTEREVRVFEDRCRLGIRTGPSAYTSACCLDDERWGESCLVWSIVSVFFSDTMRPAALKTVASRDDCNHFREPFSRLRGNSCVIGVQHAPYSPSHACQPFLFLSSD